MERFGDVFEQFDKEKFFEKSSTNKKFLRSSSKFSSKHRVSQYGNEIEYNNVFKFPIQIYTVDEPIQSFTSSVTIEWLRSVCVEKFESKEVAKTVVEILKKTREAEIQEGLFEVFGVESVSLIEKIIKNRKRLLLSAYEEQQILMGKKKNFLGKEDFLSSVKIVNEKEEKLKKQIKSLVRSITKRGNLSKKEKMIENEKEKLLDILQKKSRDINKKKKDDSKKNVLDNSVIDLLAEYYKDLDFSSVKHNLDLTTVQRDGYLEFHVAPPKPKDIVTNFKLVPIGRFPKWARGSFKGIESLNRIQSQCFPVAFNSIENMLICAPTGCGKTNCAMMTILGEISKHFDEDEKLKLREFKILYITPMKALANEIRDKFSGRLKYLGVKVREYTGDIKLSKKEVEDTQIIVTTPEKWDVITRRQSDTSLIQSVKLIIIDEIHLLNEGRGPVIECIIARTLRQIEQSQSLIRLVGLSATLPNYGDVASFLRVNHSKGLFYFDSSFRPVPLHQQYIGVDYLLQDEICFEKVVENLEKGHQVMVFVHSRKGTVTTGKAMLELSKTEGKTELFGGGKKSKIPYNIQKKIDKSRNNELKELVEYSIGFHHAGMERRDRNLVESLFKKGHVKLLCSTATLAWGVNLPAHTVIIKGTSVYSSEKGALVQLGILDVMQIFGRAGRPQFDKSGEGIIITKPEQAPRYLALLNNAVPIESKLQENLQNHLNAEIVLGSVTTIAEAIRWLTYTYLFIRLKKNPMNYGILYKNLLNDRNLGLFRRELVIETAKLLDENKMIRFNEHSETLAPTAIGRVASHFYIHFETIELINESLKEHMEDEDILHLISKAKEFEQIKVRKEDEELSFFAENKEICPVEIGGGGVLSREGKVNCLLQTYISKVYIRNFALISDCAYIIDNAGRIVRALLEIALQKRFSSLIDKLVTFNKCLDKRMWDFYHPLRQFGFGNGIPLSNHILKKLEGNNRQHKEYSVDDLYQMESDEIDDALRVKGIGSSILFMCEQLPFLEISKHVQPITRDILKVEITLKVAYNWTTKKYHNEYEPYWLFIVDPYSGKMLFYKYFSMVRKQKDKEVIIKCMIPIHHDKDVNSYQKLIRVVSDRWLGVEIEEEISFDDIIFPEKFPRSTELLRLRPLKVADVIGKKNSKYFSFEFFNPIQTQVFHTLYHTDENVLLGASTGSGKTVIADLAIIRCFDKHPKSKVIYIAPLKALVKEKLKYWTEKFKYERKVVELTGDSSPDINLLYSSDIILTTPEKWDGVTRSFKQRSYVQSVGCIIIDEVHLLGSERGAILEVIVSRARFISHFTKRPIRIIALGTSCANSDDLRDWLGVAQKGSKKGCYNFKNNVRPVQLKTHIQGFSEKYYCPRMASMNKPCYRSILTHSPNKPIIIFVSSRRQTRLTAMSLISFCNNDGKPFRFVKDLSELDLKNLQKTFKDKNLSHVIQYGIGLHHGGLVASDRETVELLFRTGKIQVIVSTATLAWGVNLPAHHCILKGTEYFDVKSKGYVQYSATDILQMMGRAGRPQFDNKGVVTIMVHESHKDFYKKFLFEPFPVESWLHKTLHNHLCAEIVSGVIKHRQDAIDYLTWTFLFRRAMKNPTYYGIEKSEKDMKGFGAVTKWLSELVDEIVNDLEDCKAIVLKRKERSNKGRLLVGFERMNSDLLLVPTKLGIISSFYYIDYKSANNFYVRAGRKSTMKELLEYISESIEFDELPVRHNEDNLNEKLDDILPWEAYTLDFESPNLKTYLLLQSHFERIKFPIADYITDLKSVLDQTVRILHAYVDISAYKGYLQTTLNIINILQMVNQARWFNESSLMMLPRVTKEVCMRLEKIDGIVSVVQLFPLGKKRILKILRGTKLFKSKKVINEIYEAIRKLPDIEVSVMWKKEEEINKGKESVLYVKLKRRSRIFRHAFTPMFGKRKEEGFWIVIGSGSELIALKRVNVKKERVVEMKVKKEKEMRLLFLSDCYLGLDQEYKLKC